MRIQGSCLVVRAAIVSLVASALIGGCKTATEDATINGTVPSGDNPNGKPAGEGCGSGADCRANVCTDGACQTAAPNDNVKNGDETDVDCGGLTASACRTGLACNTGKDCLSGLCNGNLCVSPNPTDGLRNGSETDVDCGGPEMTVPRCTLGKACLEARDCTGGVCTNSMCAAPSATDAIKNGDETDVDCGGTAAPKCANGKTCKGGSDCTSSVCNAMNTCVSASANDGVKNGGETDVDCGGPDTGTPRCATGKTCGAAADCGSGVCTGNKCQAPSPTDGIKNGDETDVDCGGASAPKCAAAKACKEHRDCASDGCNHDKKCASSRSCTQFRGGYTCGANETGAGPQEDCCQSPIVTRTGNQYRLDKFHVTAGRLRAFIDRMPAANLQTYASTLPAAAGWNTTWTASLPKTIDDVNYVLGPFGKRGCSVDGEGGRTYWQPPYPYAGGKEDKQDYSKDVLDEKAINCVPWYVLKLFCIWDGERNGAYTAHLATNAEINYAFNNGGATLYPWGNDYATAGSARLVHNYTYNTPNATGIRMVGTGANAYPLDHAFYMAPPGRRPTGNNSYGQSDVAGNMLHWIGDTPKQFTWTVSWEKHEKNLTPTTWNPADGPDGYYAIGGRCARNL